MSKDDTNALDKMSEKKRMFLFGGIVLLIVGVIAGLVILSSIMNRNDATQNDPAPDITTEAPVDPAMPEEDFAGADGYVPTDEFEERENQADAIEDVKPEEVEADEDHTLVFPGDYTFVETGLLEWCSIPAGQSWEDRLARFDPYFTADSKHRAEDLDSLLWERNCALVSETEPELNEDGTYFLNMTLQRAWKIAETDDMAEGGMVQFKVTFSADGIIDIQ